ncbi:MAG: sugar phosphate isomerase/epimerase family protein [Candidatus Latescibacteria bacterium]|jgi:sugar phosphate isomerase/epimerase|nr:sugar phosphate isomerase/epimerase family protein [Candidatus Latescibacterota bacterium]
MQQTWTWSITGYSFSGLPHEEIHRICKLAGAAGIEGAPGMFGNNAKPELEHIAEAYRAEGLAISSFHLPFAADDDIASFYETTRRRAAENAVRWMEIAAALGASVGIQHPTTNKLNVDVEGADPYVRQIGRSLETMLPAAESLGVTVALENMLPAEGGRFMSRPEHIERIIREFGHPKLGFCLDTGHALVAGGPDRAGEILDAMAPALAAFHLADNAGYTDSHLAPGRGLVDWTAVFRRAAELRYAGPMCIETRPFAHGPRFSDESWKQLVAETEALSQKALSD